MDGLKAMRSKTPKASMGLRMETGYPPPQLTRGSGLDERRKLLRKRFILLFIGVRYKASCCVRFCGGIRRLLPASVTEFENSLNSAFWYR